MAGWGAFPELPSLSPVHRPCLSASNPEKAAPSRSPRVSEHVGRDDSSLRSHLQGRLGPSCVLCQNLATPAARGLRTQVRGGDFRVELPASILSLLHFR